MKIYSPNAPFLQTKTLSVVCAVGQAEYDASAYDGLLRAGTRGLSEGRDHCKCIAPIQDGPPCRAEASRFRRSAGRA